MPNTTREGRFPDTSNSKIKVQGSKSDNIVRHTTRSTKEAETHEVASNMEVSPTAFICGSAAAFSSPSFPSPVATSTSSCSSRSVGSTAARPMQPWLPFKDSTLSMGSFLDVIRRCNKLDESEFDGMWEFRILDNSVAVGYMLPEHATQMTWENTSFKVSKSKRRIWLQPSIRKGEDVVEVCKREFVSLCEKNAGNFGGCFKKWLLTKSDYHPIRGLDSKLSGLVIASPARGIFGIVTTGVHMNVYTVRNGIMYVWVSKRSRGVTYPGKLDQVAAGAMDPGDAMEPLATLTREALEEAGLRIDLRGAVSWRGKHIGKATPQTLISFYDKKDHIAGLEEGHVEPGIRYTYDLEVDPGFTPMPQEPESIDRFMLKTVEEVKRDLKNAQWKPNCGLVMLDFLLRKGEISPRDDENFGSLRPGLQRALPFRNI